MSQKQQTTITITTGTLTRFLLLVLGVVFLYFIRDVVMIVLVSVVIASAVEPLVRWFIRYRLPRVAAVLVIYVGGILFFIAVFYFLLPPVLNDFQGFFNNLPNLLESALGQLRQRITFFGASDALIARVREAALGANFYISELSSGFFDFTSSVFSGFIAFVFIGVISFYLAVQEDGIGNVLRIVTPREHEPYILGLWLRSQRKIGRWLQGQLLLGLIVGVIVFIALTVLEVRYALILAILSAIFEIIPYFGPIMAAIPAIAVAAIQDPLKGLLVTGIYLVVQQMENHLIYPQVVRKTVGVPPLLAIIALLIGGKLGGMMGFIISIPLAVVLVEYLNDVADRKKALD